jgi:hypothetical protein
MKPSKSVSATARRLMDDEEKALALADSREVSAEKATRPELSV